MSKQYFSPDDCWSFCYKQFIKSLSFFTHDEEIEKRPPKKMLMFFMPYGVVCNLPYIDGWTEPLLHSDDWVPTKLSHVDWNTSHIRFRITKGLIIYDGNIVIREWDKFEGTHLGVCNCNNFCSPVELRRLLCLFFYSQVASSAIFSCNEMTICLQALFLFMAQCCLLPLIYSKVAIF